jgi:hypothetical protein
MIVLQIKKRQLTQGVPQELDRSRGIAVLPDIAA